MSRTKDTIVVKESAARLIKAFRDNTFACDAIPFWQWRHLRGSGPHDVNLPREKTWDGSTGRLFYYGAHYDLLELFDKHKLQFYPDAYYFLVTLEMIGRGYSPEEFLNMLQLEIPHISSWKCFRLSRSGLGLVTEEDLHALNYRKDGNEWGNLKQIYTQNGLTEEVLSEITGQSERRIRDVVRKCAEFILKTDIDPEMFS